MRSFLILLLFGTHTPLLLCATHKLYKRMEEAKIVAGKLGHVGSSAGGGHDLTGLATPAFSAPKETTPMSLDTGRLQHGGLDSGDSHQFIRNPEGDEQLKVSDNLKPEPLKPSSSFFSSIQKFGHLVGQKVLGFFGKISNLLGSSTRATRARALDEPFKQFPGLAAELTHERSEDLSRILREIFENEKSKPVYVRGDIDQAALLEEMKKNLLKAHDVKSKFVSNTFDGQLSEGLKGIFLSSKSQSDALAKIGKTLANSNSKDLNKDILVVRARLPKEQEYLADLLGILGPKNVMSRNVEEIMGELSRSNPASFASGRTFVETLESLQEPLKKFTEVVYNPFAPTYEALVKEISGFETKLIENAGTREQLSNLLDRIKASDIYKGFQRDLADPKSVAAYELQLIQPWGKYDNLKKIPLSEMSSFKSLGTSLTVGEGLQLQQKSEDALYATRYRLGKGIEARRLQSEMEQHLTPQGMRYISQKLDEAEQKRKLASEQIRAVEGSEAGKVSQKSDEPVSHMGASTQGDPAQGKSFTQGDPSSGHPPS